jgi:D-glycero-D-manno-heptose 1,7-bisphosphate phosphatase
MRAVFFDRDGVLNAAEVIDGKPYPPRTVTALRIPEGVYEALSALRTAGFVLICVTNQPDVKRGKTTRDVVEAINQTLLKQLPLDEIRVCYHDDADHCACRKPLPGLLLQAAEELDIDLSASFMIGDRWKDVEAGHNAGCRSIWLRCDYEDPGKFSANVFVADTLLEAANWISHSS